MINPSKLLKIKCAWDTFSGNHPKFTKFLGSLNKDVVEEGSIIEINVRTASGKEISSNLKVTQEDRELFEELSELFH